MTIKDIRIAQNLSQAELAAALDISVSSERSYEYGVRKPNAKVIEQIKALYGVDLNDEAPAPAVEETVEKAAAPAVAETPAKSKRGRKKKDAEAAPAPAVEEKAAEVETVEEAPAKPKRSRKKKDAAPQPASEESAEKVEEAEEAPAKKPRARKKAAPTVIIQSIMGGEINVEEIIAKVGEVEAIYVKPEENAAYWTRGDESGAVNLW